MLYEPINTDIVVLLMVINMHTSVPSIVRLKNGGGDDIALFGIKNILNKVGEIKISYQLCPVK